MAIHRTVKPFIHENFLLQTKTAQWLYHEHAARQPIFDYHCHLPPKDIAENRQFRNLMEIWLEGDHYKWRAMRANGIPERFCTGDASPLEKFRAWAATVPRTLRNPLYHWTHLELKRYFGINELLNEKSADRIWQQAQSQLNTPKLSTHGILKKFGVTTLCTTDDPVDDLGYHGTIRGSLKEVRVLPAFRPDKALGVNSPKAFNAWLDKLAFASNVEIRDLTSFLEALENRHAFFHDQGCRLSDHGLTQCPAGFASQREAGAIFRKARMGRPISHDQHAKFSGFMMLYFGRLDAKRGWVKQLHLGPLRNTNSRLLSQLGPDTGFDSIGDYPQATHLCAYLDRLEQENALPRTIIYNVNPADNYVFGTMIGNFQDGSRPGRIQWGSGWWFLDQKEGMEAQLNALSNLGLLSRFVGMVTDSRSFMSYPRHEYFRRVLCNLVGRDVENGEIPNDRSLLARLVSDISYKNACQYFGLATSERTKEGESELKPASTKSQKPK